MNDLEELGKRAAACKGWKWLPGMLIADNGSGIRYLWQDADYSHGVVNEGGAWVRLRKGGREYVPDLTDAATLGCLLQLVREAWRDDRAYLCDFEGYDSVEWGVVSKIWDEKRNEEGPKAWFSCLLGDGSTEAEALVYALEKAPCCKELRSE